MVGQRQKGDSNANGGRANPADGTGNKDSDDAAQRANEDKIRRWLEPERHEDGRLKAGDWMTAIVPHLSLHSTSTTGPHPRATFTFTVQPEHCNRLNNLHGGCAATLFDFCTTMPLILISRPGHWQHLGVSRTLNVTYLKPVARGESVLVDCEVLQAGRRLATLRGTIRSRRDGQVLALCEHGKFNIDPPVSDKL